jgi:hypothetical protein
LPPALWLRAGEAAKALSKAGRAMTAKASICWFLAAVMLATGCISTAPPAPAAPAPAAPLAPTTTPNGTTVNVSTPTQPCCPHQTLWQFLGVTGGVHLLVGIIERIRNRLGSIFPGLESTPPMVAITDPKMAASSNPAEAAAANAKADEDAAPQKIKAIRYLATLGCAGCYPGIEDALLDSLDDCTEEVRWEAAKALRELSGKLCAACKTKSCCSPKVLKKLDEVANKMEHGCYKESSARVRREARLAMAGCGGAPPAPTTGPQEGPSEGPPTGPPKPVTASNSDRGDKSGGTDDDSTTKASLVSTAAAQRQAATAHSNLALVQPDNDCGCGQSQSVIVQTTPAPKVVRSSGAPRPTPAPVRAADSTLKASAETAGSDISSEAGSKSASNPSPRAAKPATASVIRTSGAVFAEVNGELIFESELALEVDRQLANLGSSISGEEELRRRPEYIRRELARVIDRKILCQEARRSSPNVSQAAFEAADGDEAAIARAWLKTNVRIDDTVTQDQLTACYEANKSMFSRPAAVRYEQLMAPMAKFSSREEAFAAIDYVRNKAMGVVQPPMANNRFKDVEAKTFDWTTRSDAPSARLAQALFKLPVGVISNILEDDDGWRAVRVLERRAAGPIPLELALDAVRRQVLKERREYMEEAYKRHLRSRAQVWTAFDQAAGKANRQGVLPLAD